nr:hypothetical protein [Alteribacter salitolerans]
MGRRTTEHHDVEVAVFREDQRAVRNYLSDWGFKKVSKRTVPSLV